MEKVGIMLETWIGEADVPLRKRAVKIVRGSDVLDCDVIVANTKPIPTGGEVKGIVRPGAGFDNVPLDLCKERGIVCAYTPNAPSQSVAEFTLGLILAAVRGIAVPSRQWDGKPWIRPLGRQLGSLTLGVVGLGRIGKRLISLTKGMFKNVVGCDPIHDTTFDEIHGVFRTGLNELLSISDIVSVHVPLSGNEGMISRHELPFMKKHGLLINTSRGPIVEELSLLRHLKKNEDFRACIDVHAQEPYKGRLWDQENCLITCHSASMTYEARQRMEREAVDAVLAILDKRRPQWVIPGSE